MAFGGMMLTSTGRSLLAAAQLGAPLEFVHIALGDGHYNGSYNDITKLSRELLTAPIKQAVKSGEQVSVDFCIENAELSTGYYLREIGLFARSGDQLILYAYDNAGQDADYIPAGGGAVSVERVMRLLLKISGVSNVVIDGGGSVLYTTQQDFLAHTSTKDIHVTAAEKTTWNGKQPAGNYATKATTLAGYGIMDGVTKTELSAGLAGKQPVGDYATTGALSTGLAGKANKATTLAGYGITDGATDTELAAVDAKSIATLTHSESGTVHALTGLSGKTGLVSVKFKAVAAFAAGDSFKVDGVTYTAKQANGKALAANQFVLGAVVDCLLDTAGKTVNFKGGGMDEIVLVTELIVTNTSWVCPEGVKSVSVRLFGGGGGAMTNEKCGGGGGGHMANNTLAVTPGNTYLITIGAGGSASASSGGAGGVTSFSTLLSASGGSAGTAFSGGSGGTGGGAFDIDYGGFNGGSGTYGGGGGGARAGRGGNGGTYGGGGGGGANTAALGGVGCGSGGYWSDLAGQRIPATDGTNTIGMRLEFEGTGKASFSGSGGASGGGGYGGNGGNGGTFASGGGGGYGGNGASAQGYPTEVKPGYMSGGGGGGYGGNANRSGGGGYGTSNFGAGGDGMHSYAAAGKSGICILQYHKIKEN